MDIQRTGKSKLKKRIRRGAIIVVGLVAIAGITYGLTRLKPAAPTLERSTAVIDVVKRGEMRREVRGIGTLVPQLVRFVPAPSEGRVEKVHLQPGVVVGFDTVLVEMSNPKLEQEAMDADYQVKTAQAEKETLRTRLESESMTQQSNIASINAEYSQAKVQLDTDEVLGKQGLVPELMLKISRMRLLDLNNRLKVEQQRLAVTAKSVKAQVNAQESRISQLQALARLKRDQAAALQVRAGTSGVLQEISVQVGQQLATGAPIARVADPASLKAELKVAETQIKDVALGQSVAVDTRNGIIQGRVMRIDPAAREGTFVVDVELIGALPGSARPDLSVDGTIELEVLKNVLHVGRPSLGQANQPIKLFKLSADGQEAVQTQVKLGRTSVSTVEIVGGLNEGDQVILSDTATLDGYERIRVR